HRNLARDVRFGSEADICSAKRHVCFTPKSGHVQCTSSCPLWAKSGHRGPLAVFKPPIHLAMRPPGSHMTMSAGPTRVLTGVARVLIIGASRGIGLETVKAALEAGHSVRALARSARRIPVDHPKLEKMAGDALQMATVKRALTGIDVVAQSL